MDGTKDASPRTNVYVDGENLFYGALRNTPYRWLNLVELVNQASFPDVHGIGKLRYFSVRLRDRPNAKESSIARNQKVYLKALGTLSVPVEICLGKTQKKLLNRPITSLPIAGATIFSEPRVVLPKGDHEVDGKSGTLPVREKLEEEEPEADRSLITVTIRTREEKQSDVNLATHLVNDAWKDEFDIGVVVSNDTDLVEPIRVVRKERGKKVHVLCPRWSVAKALEETASHVRCINEAMLRRSQLPDPVRDVKTDIDIRKPIGW